MPGPYTTFTRANCDWPGLYPINSSEYAMHSSGMCLLMVHRPAVSFQNAPVAIFIPGDNYGFETGWGAMTGMFTGKTLALATAMSAAGWVIVTILYPPAGNNRHTIAGAQPGTAGAARLLGTIAEVHPVAMWPEQAAYPALAIQYVKGNFSGAPGTQLTPFGIALWGTGNSIDPNKVVLVGNKHGATIASYVALQPSGFYRFEAGPSHDNMDLYTPETSSRVAACVLTDPLVDFTQFHIDRLYTSPAPSFFQGDKWGIFTRSEDTRKWHALEQKWKRQCPWFELAKKYEENANLGFFTEFTGVGFNAAGWDANLVASDWSPGSQRDDETGGKAFIDATNGVFMGPAWDDATRNTYPAGTPMSTSVTRYGTGAYAPYGTSAYVTNVMAWLGGFGL